MGKVWLQIVRQLFLKKSALGQNRQNLQQGASWQSESESGLTMLEVLMVVIIVGLLATLIGPGWVSFTNRQRITRLNNAVRRSIEEAQREAKENKASYSVSFRMNDDSNDDNYQKPEVAIHRGNNTPTAGAWRLLGEGLEIKANQVELQFDSSEASFTPSSSATIAFDYQGAIDESATEPLTLYLTVAPQNGAESTKRCVIVETLLGGMRTGTGSGCSP